MAQDFEMMEQVFQNSENGEDVDVRLAEFAPLSGGRRSSTGHSLDLLSDVRVTLTVELGRAEMRVKEVLALGLGSVVELEKLAGEPADILVNGSQIGIGEIVVVDDKFSIRITELKADGAGIL